MDILDLRPDVDEPDPLQITVSRMVSGFCELVLAGDLDLATAPLLAARVRALPDDLEVLRLDVSQLAFIDSAGVRQLLVTARSLRGKLVIHRPRAQLCRVLALTGLAGTFVISHGPEEIVTTSRL